MRTVPAVILHDGGHQSVLVEPDERECFLEHEKTPSSRRGRCVLPGLADGAEKSGIVQPAGIVGTNFCFQPAGHLLDLFCFVIES